MEFLVVLGLYVLAWLIGLVITVWIGTHVAVGTYNSIKRSQERRRVLEEGYAERENRRQQEDEARKKLVRERLEAKERAQ